MKIAFISYDLGEYSVQMANGLAKQGRELLLLLPYNLMEPFNLDESVHFQGFHRPRLRQPIDQIRVIRSIFHHIHQFNPDVIHFQHAHVWFNFALPWIKRYPLVITVHNPEHHTGDKASRRTPQFVMDFGYRRADQLIVHGDLLKHQLLKRLSISVEKVHVTPHIVMGDDTAQSDIQEEDNNILFFGRIWEYKGLEYLIRAEPFVSSQIPNVKIVIAGRGEDFGRYQDMMVHPERFVVFNEYVSDSERARLFRQASIVVLPYIDATQSGVIPVAYTFSKPVIATAVGALPEAVDHGKTGYLVPPRDEKALAEAIVRLLKDKELRHQFGKAGKEKIDTECSPDAVARQTLKVYELAIASRNKKP